MEYVIMDLGSVWPDPSAVMKPEQLDGLSLRSNIDGVVVDMRVLHVSANVERW